VALALRGFRSVQCLKQSIYLHNNNNNHNNPNNSKFKNEMFTQISCANSLLPRKLEHRSTPWLIACSTARPNSMCTIFQDKCICTWSSTVTHKSNAIISSTIIQIKLIITTITTNSTVLTGKQILWIHTWSLSIAPCTSKSLLSAGKGGRLRLERTRNRETHIKTSQIWNAVMNNSNKSNKSNKPNNWTNFIVRLAFK
jgi:hypothetical protein